jgi:hypothetical protein
MPGSIEKVAELIKDYPGISIFNHLPASYYWPNFPDVELASKLYIQPIDFTAEKRDSKKILAEVCSFDSWYGHLPVLYHGFVAAKLITEIKHKSDGIFFKFSSPDIYAAIVLAMHTNQFVMVQTALTIGGQSAKSNGANYTLGTEIGKMFVAELPTRLRWRYESMSMSLAVYEALENAFDAFPDQSQIATIDKDKLIRQSISEVKDMGPQRKEELVEKLLMIYPVQTVNDAFRQTDLASESEAFNTELVQKSWREHLIHLLRRIKWRLSNKSSERQKEIIVATGKLDELPKSFDIDAGFLKLHQPIDVAGHGIRTVDQAALFLQAKLDAAKIFLDLRNEM